MRSKEGSHQRKRRFHFSALLHARSNPLAEAGRCLCRGSIPRVAKHDSAEIASVPDAPDKGHARRAQAHNGKGLSFQARSEMGVLKKATAPKLRRQSVNSLFGRTQNIRAGDTLLQEQGWLRLLFRCPGSLSCLPTAWLTARNAWRLYHAFPPTSLGFLVRRWSWYSFLSITCAGRKTPKSGTRVNTLTTIVSS